MTSTYKEFDTSHGWEEVDFSTQEHIPECSGSCELKQVLLETPEDKFNVDVDTPENEMERFLKEDVHNLKIKELKIRIEEFEEEIEFIKGKINKLYAEIFHSISNDANFNQKIIFHITEMLKNNSIEDLQKVYGNSKEE